jgi:NitT/TauT family transport system substrate-binding protein
MIVVTIAAGCGDDGGDEGSEAGSGELTPITVGVLPIADLAPLHHGIEQGFFEEEGLDVSVEIGQGGAALVPAVQSGEYQFAFGNYVSLMLARQNGVDVQIVSNVVNGADTADRGTNGLLVAPDSGIESIDDLAGRTFAVTTLDNVAEVNIRTTLRSHDVDDSGVEFVEVPFPDMATAVEGGDVAAAVLIEPFLTIAEHHGARIIGRPYSDLKPGLQIGTYVMTEEFVAANPEVVEAFQEGVQATADSIREDPDAFRDALPSLGDVSPELADQVRINLWRGATDRASLELIQELMVRYELLAEPVDLDEVVLG